MRQIPSLYVDTDGSENTHATLEAFRERTVALQVEAAIVTSSSGATTLEAARILQGTGLRVIGMGFQRHLWERHRPLEEQSVRPCLALGVEFLPDRPRIEMLDQLRSDTVNAWRCISQGFKVALQVAAQCVDTGLLREGAHVISIGGSGRGADTAVALRTYGTGNVKSRGTEVIAMPAAPKGGW